MIVFIVFFTACGKQNTEPPEAIGEVYVTDEVYVELPDWQIAYAEMLADYAAVFIFTEEELYSGGSFILYDIDRCGIPELIVMDKIRFSTYFAAYSFTDGELIKFDSVQFDYDSSRIIAPLNNRPGIITVFADWGTESDGDNYRRIGITGATFYVVEGNNLIEENAVWRWWYTYWNGDDIAEETWHVNDVEVTEEEYNRAFFEIFGFENDNAHEQDRITPFYGITEENIRSALSSWEW
jgi:hypothetical protein